MAHKRTNPDSLSFPQNYNHSVEAEAGCKYLFVAGQTATPKDGPIPQAIEAQSELVFSNMQKVLAESGYGFEDVVFMKSFLINREDRDGYQSVRARVWGDTKPASTFLLVSGLASPEYLLEVECIAAKKD